MTALLWLLLLLASSHFGFFKSSFTTGIIITITINAHHHLKVSHLEASVSYANAVCKNSDIL
jgi:hypothetical protein